MELQALFSFWARARIWSSTCITLLPISTNTSDNWNKQNKHAEMLKWKVSNVRKTHYKHMYRALQLKLSHLLQLFDIFHKSLHHLRHIQHIHGVSETCSLQGVCAHLMCHSDSIRCIDGPLKCNSNRTVRTLDVTCTVVNLSLRAGLTMIKVWSTRVIPFV